MVIVIPEGSDGHLSAAVRIAHNLLSYLRIASIIVHDREASHELGTGVYGCSNYVIMGGHRNEFGQAFLASSPAPITFTKDGWTLQGRSFDSAGLGESKYLARERGINETLGMAFLYRHPTCETGLSLFMDATDDAGLERVLRLFPFRTGVMMPEWVITGPEADMLGAGGFLGAGYVK